MRPSRHKSACPHRFWDQSRGQFLFLSCVTLVHFLLLYSSVTRPPTSFVCERPVNVPWGSKNKEGGETRDLWFGSKQWGRLLSNSLCSEKWLPKLCHLHRHRRVAGHVSLARKLIAASVLAICCPHWLSRILGISVSFVLSFVPSPRWEKHHSGSVPVVTSSIMRDYISLALRSQINFHSAAGIGLPQQHGG